MAPASSTTTIGESSRKSSPPFLQRWELLLPTRSQAKEAWGSIAAACIVIDRVRGATLQRLRKDRKNLSFRPSEQIDRFAIRLSTLKQQMARHGDKDL
jgi:hypothetical protein